LATFKEWEYTVEQEKDERYLDFLKKFSVQHDLPYKDEFIQEDEYSLGEL
jgi:hypothetical protein